MLSNKTFALIEFNNGTQDCGGTIEYITINLILRNI